MNAANPFVLPLVVVGVILASVLAFGVRFRGRSFVAREYILVVLSLTFYALPYALELASVTLGAKIFFHRLVWIGVATTPSSVALLALRYSRRRVGRGLLLVLGLVPVAMLTLEWTNDAHHWLEGPASLVAYGAFTMRLQSAALAYWIFLPFAYVCVFGALAIYGAAWLSGPPIQRRQARALFFTLLVPLVANLVYQVGASPIREFDFTPLGLGVAAVGFGWAIFREGFLDLAPVAHEAVFETIDDPIFVIDRQGRIVDANAAAHVLARRPLVAGIMARDYVDLFHGHDWPDGTHDVTFAGRSFAIRTTGLASEGRVVALHDVTDREAQERATRQALRARDEFIARMSHELRTPLQGILGSLELLAQTRIDDRQARFAGAARLSARILLGLVDEVLDFEKLDGKIVLDERDVDVRAIVDEAVTAVRDPATLKGLTLALDTSKLEDDMLRGDPQRLRQIVLNLAANAVKFTTRGSVRVVATTKRSGEAATLSIRVDDTGPGVPAESLARLFDPFVQLDGSRTRKADGVGLGLAICRRLADAMGGELVLHNRVEGGLSASFTVALPRATGAPWGQEGQLAVARALGGVRVLLVEDHPVSRAVLAQMLEELGAETLAVDSGARAIEGAAASRFDVAIVDLHMPEADGLTTIRALRASASPPTVIACTADSRASVREDCLAAGAADFILKPVSMGELASAVLRHAAAPVAERKVPARALAFEFARSYPNELGQMRRALAEGERAQCHEILHGLLGASALLGFSDVVDSCRAAQTGLTLDDIERIQRACELAVT
ncbi:MAG: response regulator [Labilithrix sp.]|nr:response regulator [Labilithrix sp.]